MDKRFGLSNVCIEDIINVFKLQSEIEEAVIFGSRAIGNYKPGSDIDISLKGNKITLETIITVSLRLNELPYAYSYDIINYNAISNPAVTAHIDELGITFYKKESNHNNWKNFKLGEIAEIISRGITPRYTDNGVPVINQRCVRAGQITFNDAKFHDTNQKKISDEKYLKINDILVNSTGTGTLGRIGQINKKIENCTYDSHVTLVRIKKDFNAIFFGYKLKSIQSLIESFAEGSTGQTELNREKLMQLDVLIPENLNTQTQIAQILSSLDDKIELNLQMNKTLEAIAQTIFKEWFVKFNFPGFDGVLTDGLPKGWRKSNLTELVETVSKTHKFPKGEAIFLNTSDILEGKFLHSQFSHSKNLPGQAKKSIQYGDILFSEIRPANKRYAFVDFDSHDYVVSTKLMVLRSKGFVDNLLIYFFMKSGEVINELQSLAETRSGTFPQITFTELSKIFINIPPSNILELFTDLLWSQFKKIRENQKQIQTLTQLRDNLLPKLMTGQIAVSA